MHFPAYKPIWHQAGKYFAIKLGLIQIGSKFQFGRFGSLGSLQNPSLSDTFQHMAPDLQREEAHVPVPPCRPLSWSVLGVLSSAPWGDSLGTPLSKATVSVLWGLADLLAFIVVGQLSGEKSNWFFLFLKVIFFTAFLSFSFYSVYSSLCLFANSLKLMSLCTFFQKIKSIRSDLPMGG